MRLYGRKLVTLMLLAAIYSSHAQEASVQTCNRDNSSRLPSESGCGEAGRDPVIVEYKIPGPTITVTTPEITTRACMATIAISYTQSNTVAEVEGTIEGAECAAASGTYSVAVVTRDGSGELKTQEYVEQWQREDNQTFAFRAEYPIGENVDLVRARANKVQCRCAESPAAE